jgi:hypothetical protein
MVMSVTPLFFSYHRMLNFMMSFALGLGVLIGFMNAYDTLKH